MNFLLLFCCIRYGGGTAYTNIMISIKDIGRLYVAQSHKLSLKDQLNLVFYLHATFRMSDDNYNAIISQFLFIVVAYGLQKCHISAYVINFYIRALAYACFIISCCSQHMTKVCFSDRIIMPYGFCKL